MQLWSDLDKIREGMEGNEKFLVDLNVDVFNKADSNYAYLQNICAPFLLDDHLCSRLHA